MGSAAGDDVCISKINTRLNDCRQDPYWKSINLAPSNLFSLDGQPFPGASVLASCWFTSTARRTRMAHSPHSLDELGRRERQIVEILIRRGRATAADVLADLPDPPSYSA